MHPQVRKLLEVQQVDRKYDRLRRSLDSIPRERQQREAALTRTRDQHAAQRAALEQAEVAQRDNELSIAQHDEELQKLQLRLNTVKNNAEYQATLLQIESVKRERAKLEEEGLELIERIETLRGEEAAAGEKLAAEEAAFAEFCKEGDEFVASKQDEMQRLAQSKETRMADVQADVRELYERIFTARNGNAVVPVEGNTCTGCYTSVQPNLLVKLQAGTAVVQCDSCQRILYVPE